MNVPRNASGFRFRCRRLLRTDLERRAGVSEKCRERDCGHQRHRPRNMDRAAGLKPAAEAVQRILAGAPRPACRERRRRGLVLDTFQGTGSVRRFDTGPHGGHAGSACYQWNRRVAVSSGDVPVAGTATAPGSDCRHRHGAGLRVGSPRANLHRKSHRCDFLPVAKRVYGLDRHFVRRNPTRDRILADIVGWPFRLQHHVPLLLSVLKPVVNITF